MSEELASLRVRVEYLERQLLDLKDKYIKLLESKLAVGNQKSEVPTGTSAISEARLALNHPAPASTPALTDLQLLFLLKESRATNKQYAVAASQLHRAYDLNRSVKTIRNKLNDLELRGFAGSIGQKPKGFFITPSGLAALDRQRRSAINARY